MVFCVFFSRVREVSGWLGLRGIRGPPSDIVKTHLANAPVCVCVLESINCSLTAQNGEFLSSRPTEFCNLANPLIQPRVDTQNGYINLREESIVFRVMMFQNDSLVCFAFHMRTGVLSILWHRRKLPRTHRLQMHECDDWRFPRNNRLHFLFVSCQNYRIP